MDAIEWSIEFDIMPCHVNSVKAFVTGIAIQNGKTIIECNALRLH